MTMKWIQNVSVWFNHPVRWIGDQVSVNIESGMDNIRELVLDGDVALFSYRAERKNHDGHDTPTIISVSSVFPPFR